MATPIDVAIAATSHPLNAPPNKPLKTDGRTSSRPARPSLSPEVRYHGLARRHLIAPPFLIVRHEEFKGVTDRPPLRRDLGSANEVPWRQSGQVTQHGRLDVDTRLRGANPSTA
jgi:hypothetical protein